MKKLFSMLIAAILAVLSLSPCFGVLASAQENNIYQQKTAEIQAFAEELSLVTQKYDNLSVSSSASASAVTLYSACDSQGTGSSYAPYSYEDFQTARLIVYSDKDFDEYGAVAHISGYENMHVLQYTDREVAIWAYTQYKAAPEIESVEPDRIVTLNDASFAAEAETAVLEKTEEEPQPMPLSDDFYDIPYTKSWGYEFIQTRDAFNYVLQHKALEDLPEIVVGIIDSRVSEPADPCFEGRLIKSYDFLPGNNSIGSHGNQVAGVILENTLPNVKIISYRTFDGSGTTMTSINRLGEEQAKLDGVDIINSSYGYYIPESSSNSLTTFSYEEDPIWIASAGNDRTTEKQYPAAYPETIAVASVGQSGYISYFSNRGDWVDIAAPGGSIDVLYPPNIGEYCWFNGTSCSTPFVVSVCAMIMTQFPTFSNEKVKEVLLNSATEESITETHGLRVANSFEGVTYYDPDARQTAMPEFSLQERPAPGEVYTEKQYLELSCSDEGAEIYYTLDETEPSRTNGTLYTEPIELSKFTSVWAVAYTDNYFRSSVSKRRFAIILPLSSYPNENGWHIRDNGMIWGYSGPDTDLTVPQTVFGIPVKGIESNAFEDYSHITSITMPESVTVIEDRAFFNCEYLSSVTAPGVTTVGEYAFCNCHRLDKVSMPKALNLSKASFRGTGLLEGFPFEKLETLPQDVFAHSNIVSVSLDSCTRIERGAFGNCIQLKYANLPAIDDDNMMALVFMGCKMLERVDFPEDFQWLPGGTFSNSNLSRVDFLPQITSVADDFEMCANLIYVDMPAAEELLEGSFAYAVCLEYASFPQMVYLDRTSFQYCKALNTLLLSDHMEYVGELAFDGCASLEYLLLEGDPKIQSNAFYNCGLKRLEFNKVTALGDLPENEGCILALPSTFASCSKDTKGLNYKVYGTKGTYAETWANENGHEFIEISQETALLQDVPMEYTDETQVLSPDVIGFNRTYQWYGSLTANNTAGEPIEGATEKEFNPADYPAYPYYYCVVTSTDVGFDPVEIRTGVTVNKIASADYTAYNQAVAEANDLDRALYQDLTALDTALGVDVSGKNITEQAIVDAQTAAIIAALESLQYKPADYTAYDRAVSQANALDRSLYEDLTALDEALALDVSGKNITEQEEVDAQTQAILDVVSALVYKSADYTEVEKAIASAPEDLSVYTDDSVSALQEALNSVNYSLNITEQSTVDGYAKAITDAVNGLELKRVEPPVTEPTKPSEPAKPTKPANPPLPDNTQNPEIPNTSAELPFLYSFTFLFLCGVTVLSTHRKEMRNESN